jgi:hypothetical protein
MGAEREGLQPLVGRGGGGRRLEAEPAEPRPERGRGGHNRGEEREVDGEVASPETPLEKGSRCRGHQHCGGGGAIATSEQEGRDYQCPRPRQRRPWWQFCAHPDLGFGSTPRVSGERPPERGREVQL